MAETKKQIYDESKIKTLSSLEHIRLRTGMYIGRIGDGSHYDDGCYILLKEVIDNAVDEYLNEFGDNIIVTLHEDSRVLLSKQHLVRVVPGAAAEKAKPKPKKKKR